MDATQIVLIVLIVALIVIYPIMIYSRNKKQRAQMQEQTNSLKRGDKVLTASGVYGTIVDLHMEGDKTIVTIETGRDNHKGYISLDAYAIYSILRDEEPMQEVPVQEVNEGSALTENSEETIEEKETSVQEVEEVQENSDSQAEEVVSALAKSKKKSRK